MTRILLADDEEDIVFILSELLKSEGYEVETAQDGVECVDTFRSSITNGASFDLVITDYRMPKKDGRQVIEEVQAAKADQKILLITAFTEDVLGLQSTRHLQTLTKPFDSENFLAKVREMTK